MRSGLYTGTLTGPDEPHMSISNPSLLEAYLVAEWKRPPIGAVRRQGKVWRIDSYTDPHQALEAART